MPGRPTNIIYNAALLIQPPRIRMFTALPIAVDAAINSEASVYSIE